VGNQHEALETGSQISEFYRNLASTNQTLAGPNQRTSTERRKAMTGYEIVKKEMKAAEAWRSAKLALNELSRSILNEAVPKIQDAVAVSGQRITKLKFPCDNDVTIELEVLNAFSESPVYRMKIHHPDHYYLHLPVNVESHIHWPKKLVDVAIDRLSLIDESEIEHAIDEALES
jgi:hypothetical protein